MSIDASAPRSRRAVLAAALGGLGAVVAARFATPEGVRAANGDTVLVGSVNTGVTATTFENTMTGTGLDHAIVAEAAEGTGLWGMSDSTTASTFASGNRTGVVGVSGDPIGVALSTDETGVYGYSNVSSASVGVWGDTLDGTGVIGTGSLGVYGNGVVGVMGDVDSAGTGLYGFSGDGVAPDATPGVAVAATAGTTAQVALQVSGKVRFSRSGRARVIRRKSSVKVVMPGVTTSSYVIATLQTRRVGVYVHAVVPAAGSFTIYLNRAVGSGTWIGYLVIN